MTKISEQEITCPECQREHQFKTYDSANVTLDPSLKEKVLSGELMRFVCPDCGIQTYVLYPLLYHDMDKKFMLYLIGRDLYESGSLNIRDRGKNLFNFAEVYRLRVVFSLHELIEKILIFDLGLDDRALELLKSSVRASQQEKDLKDGLLMFRGLVKNDEDQLQVIMTNYWGETESSVAIPYVLYETASESLLDIKAEDATAAGIWQRVDERYTFKGDGEAKTTK